MAGLYRLMHRTTFQKYVCLMVSEKGLDCYEYRDMILRHQKDIYPQNLVVWNLEECAVHDEDVIDCKDRIYEFGEGLYGNTI